MRLDSSFPVQCKSDAFSSNNTERFLFFAVKTIGYFAQLLILLQPTRLRRPGDNLLKRAAVIYGGVKKNQIASPLRAGDFVLQSGVPINGQRNRFCG